VKIGAIIEARMESTRLPGKVLLASNGTPMLERLVDRIKQCQKIEEIVIATTTSNSDDHINDLAARLEVNCFRGSQLDVLSRVLLAARKHKIDTIVEITGDCPIIDVEIIENVLQRYIESDVDYVSNSNVRSYPDGMDVQVYSTDILEKSAGMVTSNLEREHVTLHIRKNPKIFSRIDLVAPSEYFFPELGLTLDTVQDFQLLDEIICALETKNKHFSLKDTLEFLSAHPELVEINSGVTRKGDS